MPIILNGTGTISGLTAGGLPSSSVTTANIADNAVTYAKIGTTEQGQLCKAWVNFNGTSTVAIRASYNVSSITDNGTGDYTVNFTNALADANYAVCGASGNVGASGNIPPTFSTNSAFSTGSVRFRTSNYGSGFADQDIICVAIFR
jgi:hypothetical protein